MPGKGSCPSVIHVFASRWSRMTTNFFPSGLSVAYFWGRRNPRKLCTIFSGTGEPFSNPSLFGTCKILSEKTVKFKSDIIGGINSGEVQRVKHKKSHCPWWKGELRASYLFLSVRCTRLRSSKRMVYREFSLPISLSWGIFPANISFIT